MESKPTRREERSSRSEFNSFQSNNSLFGPDFMAMHDSNSLLFENSLSMLDDKLLMSDMNILKSNTGLSSDENMGDSCRLMFQNSLSVLENKLDMFRNEFGLFRSGSGMSSQEHSFSDTSGMLFENTRSVIEDQFTTCDIGVLSSDPFFSSVENRVSFDDSQMFPNRKSVVKDKLVSDSDMFNSSLSSDLNPELIPEDRNGVMTKSDVPVFEIPVTREVDIGISLSELGVKSDNKLVSGSDKFNSSLSSNVSQKSIPKDRAVVITKSAVPVLEIPVAKEVDNGISLSELGVKSDKKIVSGNDKFNSSLSSVVNRKSIPENRDAIKTKRSVPVFEIPVTKEVDGGISLSEIGVKSDNKLASSSDKCNSSLSSDVNHKSIPKDKDVVKTKSTIPVFEIPVTKEVDIGISLSELGVVKSDNKLVSVSDKFNSSLSSDENHKSISEDKDVVLTQSTEPVSEIPVTKEVDSGISQSEIDVKSDNKVKEDGSSVAMIDDNVFESGDRQVVISSNVHKPRKSLSVIEEEFPTSDQSDQASNEDPSASDNDLPIPDEASELDYSKDVTMDLPIDEHIPSSKTGMFAEDVSSSSRDDDASTLQDSADLALSQDSLEECGRDDVRTPPSLVDVSSADCTIPQKPMLARPAMRQELPAALRPSSSGLLTPPAESFLPPVDAFSPLPPPPLQSQPPPNTANRSGTAPSRHIDELSFRSLDEADEVVTSEPLLMQSHMLSKSLPATRGMGSLQAEERERIFKFRQLKEKEQESVSSNSAPAALETAIPVTPPEATPVPTPTVTSMQILQLDSRGTARPLTTEVTLDPPVAPTHTLPAPTLPAPTLPAPTLPAPTAPPVVDLQFELRPPPGSSVPPKRTRRLGVKTNPSRTLRGGLQKEPSRSRPSTQTSSGPFSESLQPLERPRESLQLSVQQIDSTDWEVTMKGLQTMVRLIRHHPATVQGQVHTVMAALARQVRNLRSQVSRAACQTSGELFEVLHRGVETDLDELVGPLFHRSADTNKFLRADCNKALDKMVEAVSPARAVTVIVTKGANHHHAQVRTAAARLLAGIVAKMGPERVMLSPRETRDRIITTGAALLTEGSLDTRCFAKQLFRTLSSHPNFTPVITEVIPAPVMRNIAKTLQNLKNEP